MKLALHLHPFGEGRMLLLSRDVTALEQADAMRRDFVANVSHEIRTPLTVLAGFVETLQSLDLAREERDRYLRLMEQADAPDADAGGRPAHALRAWRAGPCPAPASGRRPAPSWVSAGRRARALADALGKRLDLRCAAPPSVSLAGAPGELQSAFSNLVSNAVRYTPSGGRVEVRASAGDGAFEFAVRDTGPGIAPEHLPRLTERFYRVDRSRSRESGGTGLGLAIVKHVVQRHGGELRIESMPGQGSTFTIVLPAARVRPLRPAAPDAPAAANV